MTSPAWEPSRSPYEPPGTPWLLKTVAGLVPATTLTVALMANTHQIGWDSAATEGK